MLSLDEVNDEAVFNEGSLPEFINHLNLHFIRRDFPNEF